MIGHTDVVKRRPFDPWLEDEAALDRKAPSRRRVLIITLLSVLLLALFVIAVGVLASGIGELMEYLSPDPESH